ncbi:hypothetical protein [Sphingomicrobium aestuariivivum]|uniref:hypothetical protein n=1 Tax=Sphingomicrobium aestuariivivum TaxID=1582356 RepID=UPI001FD6B378|nr:hypothetical protein [Sphingomicrobium aestuariivivum]MCJ8191865.1 hypothetical protein [Sphingomicrobium aestuariivivum]
MLRSIPFQRRIFALLVVIVSLADYFEHILRPDGEFMAIWLSWAGFTAASTLSVLAIFLGLSALLDRGPLPGWVNGSLGFATAIMAHVTVTGPLWGRIFSSPGQLMFDAPLMPAMVAGAAYGMSHLFITYTHWFWRTHLSADASLDGH